MKKALFTMIGMLMFTITASAKYEPNTKWPYLYEDFTKGYIYSADNKKSEFFLNIHLSGNILHYIGDDGRIYKSNDKQILRVEIGDDTYIFYNHRLVKLLCTNDMNMLAELTKTDFSSLLSGTGAYGASLNSSSAVDLSSLDLGGLNTPEHGKMLQEKNNGRTLPLSTEYFFIIDNQRVDANKKAIGKMIPNDKKDQWESLLKNTKIRWKDSESLCKILDFLSTK